MDDDVKARFSEFVTLRAPALVRVAYLLTGDRHAAEDLVQSALVKTLTRWQSLRNEDPEGYVRTVMYREQISRWRRWSRHRERLIAPSDDLVGADPHGQTDLRVSMREALLRLSPAHRTILVLRYYEDLTETQVAAVLDCSIGSVRSRTHRALTRLRQLLPDTELLIGTPLARPAQRAADHKPDQPGARLATSQINPARGWARTSR
ncbi:SigE family RNA polymerase sigma factor [Rugosimonospora africana]|uniref:RNA polymerase sigma24 factor n=1 Tax=Rugosimonospora africana TaxID=556532 RepID=A0A8J3QWH6_9ACTN|nr:RNA polymerase sigma24 factor [Rugosimonospora africana]